jgi:2',3'-cyclic-nucleotide 2'-phosphodiesterase (5'-nucleotidase family)
LEVTLNKRAACAIGSSRTIEDCPQHFVAMIGYDILQSTVGLGVVCLCGKTTTLLLLQLVTIVTATASDINTANQPTPTLAPSISSSSNPTAKPKVTTTATSDSQISNSDIAEADGPRLPFGDINVVVVTDVHSWVAGHGEKEPKLDADYGDILSFVQHLKTHFLQNEPERDLWFVMNGDWIDGTGLAMNRDPSHLIPLLEKMPWDALNVGNHELYEREGESLC